MVQSREWKDAHDVDLIASSGNSSHDFDHGRALKLVDGEHDIFGDGQVVCLPTYGHTPGAKSLKVRTEKG